MTRLVDTFGADVAVSIRERPELTAGDRLRARLAAEDRTTGCTACELHEANGGQSSVPLVPFWSPAKLGRAGRVAVLVDAPTFEEHHAGELGRGALYRAVRQEFRDNGIARERVTYLTCVACTPLAYGPRRGLSRVPPERKHVDVCTANVLASLDAADVNYVLLLGGHATRAWRADLRLADVTGQWFVWGRRWLVWPTEHPSVVLKSGTRERTQWREQVAAFCRGVNDGVGLESLGTGCVTSQCAETWYVWDDDGVPWCKTHFKPHRLTREARAGTTKTVDTAQGSML